MRIFKYAGGGHFSISRSCNLKWMKASDGLRGYDEILESRKYCMPEEIENAEEGLMKISEWDDSKWKSLTEENERETEILSEIV